jgi:hypothetical protein
MSDTNGEIIVANVDSTGQLTLANKIKIPAPDGSTSYPIGLALSAVELGHHFTPAFGGEGKSQFATLCHKPKPSPLSPKTFVLTYVYARRGGLWLDSL